jgi:hypothetical protein
MFLEAYQKRGFSSEPCFRSGSGQGSATWSAGRSTPGVPRTSLQDALAGYFDELAATREKLNSRYDDLKSGRVKPIRGVEVKARLSEKSSAHNPAVLDVEAERRERRGAGR